MEEYLHDLIKIYCSIQKSHEIVLESRLILIQSQCDKLKQLNFLIWREVNPIQSGNLIIVKILTKNVVLAIVLLNWIWKKWYKWDTKHTVAWSVPAPRTVWKKAGFARTACRTSSSSCYRWRSWWWSDWGRGCPSSWAAACCCWGFSGRYPSASLATWRSTYASVSAARHSTFIFVTSRASEAQRSPSTSWLLGPALSRASFDSSFGVCLLPDADRGRSVSREVV